jgi:hypothetical protein
MTTKRIIATSGCLAAAVADLALTGATAASAPSSGINFDTAYQVQFHRSDFQGRR